MFSAPFTQLGTHGGHFAFELLDPTTLPGRGCLEIIDSSFERLGNRFLLVATRGRGFQRGLE